MHGLRGVFLAMEIAIFPEWQKAKPERREEITKQLGQLQGKMILDQIEKEVANLHPNI